MFTIVVHLTGSSGSTAPRWARTTRSSTALTLGGRSYGPGNKGTSALFLSNGPVTIGGAAVRGNVQSTLGPVTLQEQSVVTAT